MPFPRMSLIELYGRRLTPFAFLRHPDADAASGVPTSQTISQMHAPFPPQNKSGWHMDQPDLLYIISLSSPGCAIRMGNIPSYP